MRISLLNLISTPVQVLNSLGLDLRIGLSSEDPMVARHPSEAYDAFLTVYSSEGLFMTREHLGRIEANRRQFFDITGITRKLISDVDHLVVVHRVPSKYMDQVSNVEQEIEFDTEPDYRLFRSLVEYSYPHGGNGSVIYETPPRFNAGEPGPVTSNTLTFTCQTVLSDTVNSHMILIHYSANPSYSAIATYNYVVYGMSGEKLVADSVRVGPFSSEVLDMSRVIPEDIVARERDPEDGISSFNFVGYCADAAVLPVIVNTAPSVGGIAVEHTHPPQTYLMPYRSSYQRDAKLAAEVAWKSILKPDVGL
jgi:hypothetical protein